MQAILRKIYGRKPYLRHDVQNVPVGQRCTFSNEQHCRQIVLTKLQFKKRIYIPPLYKLPPKDSAGLAIPMHNGQLLHLADIKLGQNIFESADAGIVISIEQWEQNQEIERE